MRNKIFGGIGILWGGVIVIRWMTADTPPASGGGSAAYNAGYAVGHFAGLLFGVVMLLAGLYYFFKKPKTPS